MDILNKPGIYRILNITNNKSYIGQSVNLRRRSNAHFIIADDPTSVEYNTPLHRAIRKYGRDNFRIIALEYCTRDELNVKERYYISLYETFPITSNKGYNQTAGGDAATTVDQLYPKLSEITLDLMQSDFTQSELSTKYKCSLEMIQGINTGRYWFRDTLDYPLRQYSIKKSGAVRKKIAAPGYGDQYQFSKTIGNINKCACCGKEISPYGKYCRHCAQALKNSDNSLPAISKADLIAIIKQYRNKHQISKNMHIGPIRLNHWLSFYQLDIKQLLKKPVKNRKKVLSIGRFLSLTDTAPETVYKGYTKASEALGIKATSMIKKACQTGQSYHGYYWKYC